MYLIVTTFVRTVPESILRLLSIFLVILFYSSTGILHAQKLTPHPQVHLNTASPFADGFAKVVSGAKSYFIDTAGNYAFDEMLPLENPNSTPGNFTLVFIRNKITHKNKWGVIKKGQWVLQPVYDSIDTRFTTWKLLQNGKRTYCDTTGKLLVPLRFSDIGYLDGNFFDVRQNGKWGIYDSQADSLIIPFQYDAFDYCGGCSPGSDYVLASKNKKWGVLGFNNKVRVPFEYEHEHFRMRSDEWVLSLQRKSKQVLINMNTGKIFAEPEYEFPENIFWNNLVCLVKNNKSGLVTAEGKPVTKFEYDYITWFDEIRNRMINYACVLKNGKSGLIDTTGKLIIPISHKGLIWAYDDSTFYVDGEDGKMLLDRSGNKLLPEYYTDIQELQIDDKSPWLFSVSKNDKYGLYDRRLKQLTPHIYDDISANGLYGFIVVDRDKKKGLFSLQGKEILPPQYDFIFRDLSDTGLLKLKIYLPDGSGQEGLANIYGKELLPTAYSSIDELNINNIFLLQKDSSYFLFNSQTGKKDSLPFNEVSIAGRNGLLLVNDGKATKLFNAVTGRIVADGYESIYSFQDNIAIAQKQGKRGVIDVQGRIVVPFVYTQLSEFSNGVAVVQKDNEYYGYIDSTGLEIVPPEYDKPEGFINIQDYTLGDNLLLFKQGPSFINLLKGLARKDGKVIAPPQYEIMWKDENGPRYLVRQKGKYGVMAADGKLIIPTIYNDIYGTNINRYSGVISLTFPLLCYDGKNWKYVTLAGTTLPFTASNIAQP